MDATVKQIQSTSSIGLCTAIERALAVNFIACKEIIGSLWLTLKLAANRRDTFSKHKTVWCNYGTFVVNNKAQ